MLNKKFIIPTVLGMMLLSCSVYAATNIKDMNNEVESSNNVVATSAIDKEFVPKVKHEEISDINKIKNNFPVKEEKPTVNLGELKEVSINATHDTYNPDFPNYITNVYRIMTKYQSASGKELIIVQGNADDNEEALLSNVLNKIGTAKVKGVEAVVCESNNGYTQVIFVKNKKFYNILGYKINKEELEKIADSLQ